MIVNCPNCSAKMSVPVDYAGIEGHCPKCNKPFLINEPEKPPVPVVQPPAVAMPKAQLLAVTIAPSPPSRAHSLSMAGWICFFIGMALLILCPIIPFYSPFFLVSFVLAIVLLVKEKGTDGLALLLMTLLLPTVVGGMIFMLGVGTALSAFSGFIKEVEDKQNALVTQQTAMFNQLSAQQARSIQQISKQPAPLRPIFLQPPATPAPLPGVRSVPPPSQKQLPTREVTYDGLLLLLNRYGIEFKSANTTAQKQDIRTRAQKEAVAFVENTRTTLAGTVSDVQYGADGIASLTIKKFDAPDYDKQAQKTMWFIPATGKIKVPLTREAALTIKSGQKVWLTGAIQLVPCSGSLAAGFGENINPSILMMMFSGDIEVLLKLRLSDYTVSFEEKRVQSAPAVPRVKKPYSLIVVSPKASP